MTLRQYLPSLVLLTCLVHPCLAAASTLTVGDHVFLRVNVRADDSHLILSANYHEDHLLPAGTEVVITEISDPVVRFQVVAGGEVYVVMNVNRDFMNITRDDLMTRLFSRDNPLAPGTPFETFTEEEKENVLSGTVAEGMGRDAVLMAYGYPPGYQDSSLRSELWVYWDSRWSKKMLYFQDDRVVQVADAEVR